MATTNKQHKKKGKTATAKGNKKDPPKVVDAEVVEESQTKPNDEKKKKRTASSAATSRRKTMQAVSPPVAKKRRTTSAKDDDYTGGNSKSSGSNKESSSETEEEQLDRILNPDRRVREEDERKRAARKTTDAAFVTPRPNRDPEALAVEVNEAEGWKALSPTDALQAALDRTTARLRQAEKQVRVISKTKLADSFQESRVRSWSKETLWKQLKFITNDTIMNQAMRKAAKYFKVNEEEKGHWMSTYAHVVRDGLNQKRNACSQAMRKALFSKYDQDK